MALSTDGPAAPPRLNGELAFDEPWQSRVFGLTAVLVEAGALSWPEMQASLISRVASADSAGNDGSNAQYWTCWLDAVAELLAASGAVPSELLSAASQAFADRSAH